jgi:hypothetical protein
MEHGLSLLLLGNRQRSWRSKDCLSTLKCPTRYIARPNAGMVQWAAEHFSTDLIRHAKGDDSAWSAATRPPPTRATCIHIRHGDKGSEMR